MLENPNHEYETASNRVHTLMRHACTVSTFGRALGTSYHKPFDRYNLLCFIKSMGLIN